VSKGLEKLKRIQFSSPTRGLLFRVFDEVDAASGACCDWRRDLDGDDGDVADMA